ncbi:hypothetical protein PCASD_11974 [Puccinia coronata f. sp. avenae]|uniref:Transcription factor IIIC 90kDa subunit N-terminal domain-containing protein n=1 Tax=Puccinia coronata f. sp. avenae TaxID=200324 RepID=A0A2N5UA92_9BASI|nr:hypothetical protein PCASD_11974 [Puccinia coronata f. sp. avenae]
MIPMAMDPDGIIPEHTQPTQHQRKPTNSSYAHAEILQTLPIDPSPSCLEWSNDGQAYVITKANVYLLTPILGYLVPPEDPHTHKQTRSNENGLHGQDNPSTPSKSHPSGTQEISQSATGSTTYQPQMPFFMTIIEINKQLGVNWSSHSNDVSTITPPNDDRFWRTASWSPSGLSALGSCLLAALSTTCDVFVFSPSRNFQTGLWEIKESLNLSEELLKFFYNFYPDIVGHQDHLTKPPDVSPETEWDSSEEAEEKRSRFTSCVLRTQATCLSWSPSYSHSNLEILHAKQLDTMHDVDFSLLAIGHRRGDISLWRHTFNAEMELQSLNPICTNGHTMNLLSWSDWKLSARRRVDESSSTHEYQLTAYLAAANSKGVVYLLRITRPFERPSKPISPISRIEIQTTGVYQDPLNQSSITYLKWLPEYGNTPPRIVLSRLGEIILVPVVIGQQNDCQSGLFRNGTQVIQLPVLQPHDDRFCWADCNSWATCSGISIIPTKFPGSIQIVAMLSNGLIFVLKESFCTDPCSAPSSSASVNSLELDLVHSVQLSLDFRAKFRSIGFSAHPPPNNIPITKQNVMSVYGSCVLSSLQHVSGDHQQLHSVDQTSLSSGCIMSWLYEIDAPNKFRYKPENYQIVQFCLADINPLGSVQQPANPEKRTQLLEILETQITAILPAMFVKSVSSLLVSPTLKLLNIFNILHSVFSDPIPRGSPCFDLLSSSLSKLVDLLQVGRPTDNSSENYHSALPPQHYSDHQSDPDGHGCNTSLALKSQLISQIFYNHDIDELRLKINLCNFLLIRIDKAQFTALRTRLVELKVALSRAIHRIVLQTIAQFFSSHQFRLSDHEKPVFNKYQCATRVIDRFPEPTIEQLLEPDQIDHKLLDQDRLCSATNDSLGNATSSISVGGEATEVEQCPACLQSVCFDSLRFAICRVGHVWDRCSVTFQILSTIKVRICTGCGRKSMVRGGGDERAKTIGPDRVSQEAHESEAVPTPSTSGVQKHADANLPGKHSAIQALLDSSICSGASLPQPEAFMAQKLPSARIELAISGWPTCLGGHIVT